MGILDLCARLLFIIPVENVPASVLFFNKLSCCFICFFRNTRGICTEICDKTDGTVSLYINTLIQLLGQTHGLLGGKIQRLGGLLLQRTGRKRKRRLLRPLSALYI